MTAGCSDRERQVGGQAGGTTVEGLRHGRWRIVHPDGSVEEGCYAGGLLHGEWTLRDPAGRTVARERWCLGRSAGSGPPAGEDASCGVTVPDACRQEPESGAQPREAGP